jgi:hypothetical protein
MARGTHRVLLAALAATIALAAACGDPDAVYIENDKAGVFVQLPDGWGTFDVIERDPSKDPSVFAEGGQWRVGFDGSTQPRRANLETPVPAAPVGYVQALPFERDRGTAYTSYKALRSTLFFDEAGEPVDILDPTERERLALDLEVNDYDELYSASHYGVRVTVTATEGEEQLRVTNLVFIDTNARRLHMLGIQCSTSCYEAYAEDIQGVLDSWTLKELK